MTTITIFGFFSTVPWQRDRNSVRRIDISGILRNYTYSFDGHVDLVTLTTHVPYCKMLNWHENKMLSQQPLHFCGSTWNELQDFHRNSQRDRRSRDLVAPATHTVKGTRSGRFGLLGSIDTQLKGNSFSYRLRAIKCLFCCSSVIMKTVFVRYHPY